jgi:hypothetical protein
LLGTCPSRMEELPNFRICYAPSSLMPDKYSAAFIISHQIPSVAILNAVEFFFCFHDAPQTHDKPHLLRPARRRKMARSSGFSLQRQYGGTL